MEYSDRKTSTMTVTIVDEIDVAVQVIVGQLTEITLPSAYVLDYCVNCLKATTSAASMLIEKEIKRTYTQLTTDWLTSYTKKISANLKTMPS